MIRPRTAGFSLVEVMIVIALTVPILLVIGSGGQAAFGSFRATEQAAMSTQVVMKTLTEVEHALRFSRRETLTTPATRQDVRLGRATAEGSFFPLPAGEPRSEIETLALVGDEDGPALLIPTRRYRLTFVPDPADVADGVDNDGDGLVDEGSLTLLRGDDSLLLVDDLEQCTFERQGNAVNITLRCVHRGHGRLLQRTTLRQTVFINNL